MIDQLAARLTEAAERNHQRWPIVPVGAWENDIEALKEWLRRRTLWFQAELLEIPEISRSLQTLPTRVELRHGGGSGTIY